MFQWAVVGLIFKKLTHKIITIAMEANLSYSKQIRNQNQRIKKYPELEGTRKDQQIQLLERRVW